MAANPWDQREDEQPEAYARFLIYRNLGVTRSLVDAYGAYLSLQPGAKKGNKKLLLPGSWAEDSSRFDWVARSTAWDVHHLSKQGPELVVLWTEILLQAARKAARKLADPRCKPTTFAGCLSVIEKLSPYLTPELCRALTDRHQEPEPPDSCSLDRLARPEDRHEE